ncbi:hypothetical protein [Phaffia rhodozyma]|uniref:Uncharacterized protein n=1 Tax=Phaffia rhodozyma TaxID=264483 RepID=A0A0F7SX04_PHARH|nr:hypothetical protein [Phaffia rhodozyma]
MSLGPVQPPQLHFQSSTYLLLTLSSPVSVFTDALVLSPSSQLLTSPVPVTYISPVGELPDEHIVSVENVRSGSQDWARIEKDVLDGLKGLKGVRAVKVMDPPSQRFKKSTQEL